jgi:molybdenum cofactor sulfurtransferase
MKKSARTAFLKQYPEYKTTRALDALRKKDFPETNDIYLDYTGGGRYSTSQLKKHLTLLEHHIFGNPHSNNPTSRRATDWMKRARREVLHFFNASAQEYSVIFTPNASGALRLVGESYPFSPDGRYVQLLDDHNSVNGLREFARSKGAKIRLVRIATPAMRADTADLTDALADYSDSPHLFAYPAQSNFTGVQHSLDWIAQAQAKGWDVVLDAAAFAPTNALDLTKYKPDFVALSFYKIFGWPTGVGCLIAKKASLAKLSRPWFAGGSIWAASAQGDWHIPAPEHEGFEDGTVNYLNLPGVIIGLDYIRKADLAKIHTRVTCLTGWLLQEMTKLVHKNGQPLIQIYGPTTTQNRGGTIAFNFLNPQGQIIDERIVEQKANTRGISLRTGCFCNPGSGEVAFQLPVPKLKAGLKDGRLQTYDPYLRAIGLQSAGAIRISVGIVSNFADVQAFLGFAETFLNKVPSTAHLAPRTHC